MVAAFHNFCCLLSHDSRALVLGSHGNRFWASSYDMNASLEDVARIEDPRPDCNHLCTWR